MRLLDKIRACSQRNETLPLKGHIRLVLEDVRDGTQKVEEVDNLATNAIQSILDHNYSGLANFASLLPLRNLHGGVFCFQNTQTENANNYNPPCDTDNPLIAHAGDTANDTGSLLRGSPVTNDFVITDTSIKQVWLWDNTQGNGHIESISLVPATLGNMGLKPFDATYNPMSAFGADRTNIDTWNVSRCKEYPLSISSDGKTSKSVWIDGTDFTEYTARHDYFAFGIMRGTRDWQEVSSRTATIRSGNNRFVFEDDDYYYIANAMSATNLQVDKVSKNTFVVTQADCTFSGVSLYTGAIATKNGDFKPFAFDGTYLYYPNSAGNQFLKLNLSDNSDVLVIDGTLTIEKTGSVVNSTPFMEPLSINSGLILGGNYIINGNKAYPIKHVTGIGTPTSDNSNMFLWLVKNGASMYGNAIHSGQSSWNWSGQSNVMSGMFLSTIANLPDAKDKSTSQTMRVEYTVMEQT